MYEEELSGRWVVGCSVVQGKTKEDLGQGRDENKMTCFAVEPMYLSGWKWKGFISSMGILGNVVCTNYLYSPSKGEKEEK